MELAKGIRVLDMPNDPEGLLQEYDKIFMEYGLIIPVDYSIVKDLEHIRLYFILNTNKTAHLQRLFYKKLCLPSMTALWTFGWFSICH